MLDQREATYRAICDALRTYNIDPMSVVDFKSAVTGPVRKVAISMLVSGLDNGDVELLSKPKAGLRSYASGLISNWIRKDTRMNGGTRYIPKNPGTKSNGGDATVRLMKTIMSVVTDDSDKARLTKMIQERTSSLLENKDKV